MSNLIRSLVLTSNQPISNICLHSNQLGYHMFGLQWPRLKPPSPVSIIWNCTTGIWQAHVTCCHTGTLVHWDSTQTEWPGSVFLDPVSIPGWIHQGYLKYANFSMTEQDRIRSKDRTFLKPGLNRQSTCTCTLHHSPFSLALSSY